MNTEIEDFIKENKREFDTDRPSAGLWDKIEKELDKKKPRKKFNIQLWMSIAASAIVLMSITFFFAHPGRKNKMSIADVNPAYANRQVKFASMIEEKRDSLQIFAEMNPELYRKFSADLQTLSTAYDGLRKQLPSSPNQQIIVKAMVKNLEMQLQLLSQQLSIISEVSEFKKENKI
ncbi:hypothetical protein SAMN06265348_106319 [Pedobacter westerhofensis]|uniref:Anti-sigma factor n=1 Tax=Pedobacter westerhofensis TaxID=425512 RepID=A0A521DWZ5_9SPHI|nr:hypothetical protein [Pedobacter westerhofensis]SMO76259.1 hypothetical protein SAMN06265348_106319 [Pedobacter westerhofensis]